MTRISNRRALMGFASALAMTGVMSNASLAEDQAPEATETVLFDFESGSVPANLEGSNAALSLVESKGGSALRAVLSSGDNLYTNVTFKPENLLDLSGHEAAGLAMDITNPMPVSVQLNLDVRDASGQTHTRSKVISANSSGTYFVEVIGPDLQGDSGLRDNPSDWIYDGEEFIWMWGTKQIDASKVAEFSLISMSLASDREILIDNVRVVADPPRNPNYLVGIVDPFGQMVGAEFPEKVSSTEALQLKAVEELDGLTGKAMPGRSKWQGWKDGPKLEGTGYFRTAKVNGKWSMVDPDGYLFFSNGIANVRMSNTSTMTGYDFRPNYVDRREDGDTTPEDSEGMNRVSNAALPGRFVSSSQRAEMFTWLPDYKGDLGDHYGYRRAAWSGPLQKGETISWYRLNLERKYGDRGDESYMDDWRQVTKARMVDWGFTSFGNWLDPSFYADPAIPYFANGWIIGDFKTVSSGDDLWAPLPDPFDPLFAERAEVTVRQVAAEVNGSPWCVGVFIDNEKSWGRPEQIETRYGIVINTMGRDAKDTPAKAHWMGMLKDKYGTIGALNSAWKTDFVSWDVLAKGVTLTNHNEGKIADYSILLEAFASEYFRIVDEKLEKHMPNHMYLGVRFATWGMNPEVVNAAKKYVDVVSYNEYKEVPHDATWSFLDEVDMPSIIGEFHMGASGSALYHPGLVHASDQNDRARMYKQYMETVVTNPNFVGAHWFQYIDSPLTGRAYDGENYNVGFVTVADIPYETMVKAAREVNASLYRDRFGDPQSLNQGK
ncbi:beta-galactosidase [Erythrobacter sp. W53]|uniref:beta-galactosidase n=1 Tax=Erythrobacter sp. W53 TaxID=3425947 RepID=UPI003D7696FF